MRLRLSLVLAALCALPAAGGATESCRTCHPDAKGEFEASVHARLFGCTDCHGGDPTLLTKESHAIEKRYVGRPDRRSVPALCASCHADPKRMKPFGQPTDQYSQYQTSEHGLLLATGDTHVAVCTDCHGSHRVLPRGEPTSPVAPRNIAATCARCHSDRPLMTPYDIPTDQEAKVRESVHGVALYVDEHPLAPTCATCHGTHGATAFHGGDVSTVCGHCHQRAREYFNQGPHAKAAAEGKMSECVSCHGFHDITPPDRALFDTACASCHGRETELFAVGQRLKTVLSRASESLDTAVAELARQAILSPSVARYRPRLQQARAHLMEAFPVQHALTQDRVEDLARNARSVTEEVRASLHGVEEERRVRVVGLAFCWAFILFAVALTYLYLRERRQAREQDQRDG